MPRTTLASQAFHSGRGRLRRGATKLSRSQVGVLLLGNAAWRAVLLFAPRSSSKLPAGRARRRFGPHMLHCQRLPGALKPPKNVIAGRPPLLASRKTPRWRSAAWGCCCARSLCGTRKASSTESRDGVPRS
ncbi:hypothetical protein BDY21DRAFT_216259 [Lineolata rhizophorae]|uniref:Uncharacterized protein n=1 Tax=Lineolata rhizophorae TaxID=578093 RepID=A0A6A6P2J1_9PEZI|nr:hypothetical protein BDY21DRAFT_216259 [Lineolata rhizophorae]